MWRAAAAVMCALAAGGCWPVDDLFDNPVAAADCSPQQARQMCDDSADSIACHWATVYERRGDGQALASVVDADDPDLDAALVRLLPALEGKTLADGVLRAPGTAVFQLRGYEPYTVGLPIDWTADPEDNHTWRFYFQDLSWIDDMCRAGGDQLDTAAQIIVDWEARALYAEPALEWTWRDHALAVRLNRVATCLDLYLASRDEVDRGFVRAAAAIIATHLHALGVAACYTYNNHGAMEDLAVLENVRRYPALDQGEALWGLALSRLGEQTEASVTADGIHVENSPDYHLLYLDVLDSVIDALQVWAQPVPADLVDARDRLIGALVYQLQPNMTLPQFGDTENGERRQTLEADLETARRQSVGDETIYARLEWVLTGGAAGTMPGELDRVFEQGGYAAFRSAWDPADPDSVVTGHFSCKRLAAAHYHRDEGTFEIYGHGQELIVDTGKYSYDDRDPLVAHQYDVAAHNVVTIDDRSYEPSGPAGILAHGSAGNVSWVQGYHANYASLGIRSQVRTFAHDKPDHFVVVDHIDADGRHRYTQHFHLHPSLSRIEWINGTTAVATTRDGRGPTVVIAPVAPPEAWGAIRGEQTDQRVQGWHFESWETAAPASDITFRYDRAGGRLAFPVVIAISAPGTAPTVPVHLGTDERDGEIRVTWRSGAAEHVVAIPGPR